MLRLRERLGRLVRADETDVYGAVAAAEWGGMADGSEANVGDVGERAAGRGRIRRHFLFLIRWRPLLRRVGLRIAVVWVLLAVMSVQAEMVVNDGLLDDPAALLFEKAGAVPGEVSYAAWVEIRGVPTSRPPHELDLLRERVAAWLGPPARTGPTSGTGIAPLPDGWLLRVSGTAAVDAANVPEKPTVRKVLRGIGVDLQQARGEFLAALAAGERAMAAFPGAAGQFLSRLSPRYWGAELSGTVPEIGASLLSSVDAVKRWAVPRFQAAGVRLTGVEWTPDEVKLFGRTHRLPSREEGGRGRRGLDGRPSDGRAAGADASAGDLGAGDDVGDANLEMSLRPRSDGRVDVTVRTRPALP